MATDQFVNKEDPHKTEMLCLRLVREAITAR